MFNKTEMIGFKHQFEKLGIASKNEQEVVLDYFIKLGKIIYKFSIKNHGEKN